MTMKKKYLCLLVAVMLICVNVGALASASAGVDASPVFVSKSVSVSSSMNVTMACTTSVTCDSICVSAVALERKSGSSWVPVKPLTPPSKTVSGVNNFATYKDYSGDCTKGNTYRFIITFNADGVTAQATSGGTEYK